MIDVLITDAKSTDYYQNDIYFEGIDKWAQANCASYIGYFVTDVSDSSPIWDEIACYQFKEEKCANWFKLRWS
jgi:hypothetical protein